MDRTPSVNPLAGPRLWNRAAPDYLREVAPGLSLFAADALRLAGVRAGMRVADVASGPGSLSFAAVAAGARASALDFSPEMIGLLRERARREGSADIEAQVGDGMALPWPDAQFDAAFSLFGLIFFPDRARGLAELRRVLRPGGRAVVSSWVPADRAPVIADVFAVLAAELPDLPYTRVRPALGDPETFRAELTQAGFVAVEVHEVQHVLEAASVLEYWRSLERSTPPLLAIQESLPASRWAELSGAIARRLEARFGSGPVGVPLMAFLGAGTRPER
jgi:ubiquinone/menaquinone biosynthesis C-methylase UbiE